MTALVLDASAALELLLDRDGRAEVRNRLREQVAAGEPILVPHRFWSDVLDVLAEHHPPAALVEAVYELRQLGLETADLGAPGALAIVDGVGRGVTAGDAVYLVLAEATEARILTANPTLASVAGDLALQVGGAASGRGRPPRTDRSWASWKGAAAYLRELRASL